MDNWPDNDALLAYVKESREHERAWKIVAGLSKRLLQERECAFVYQEGRIRKRIYREARDEPVRR